MSDDKNLPAVPQNDFTMKDLQLIEKFKENGLLGLHTLKENDAERCMGLYLDGKTYREIANLLKIEKSVILYLAHKFKWWELRQEYLEELRTTLKDKVLESKLESQQFLMHLTLAYKKKIGKSVDKYLRTDNEEFHDNIDGKDVTVLLKLIELLQRLEADTLGTPQSDKTLVGLNGLGEGMTITKVGENSVEITPKVSQYSSKLKQMAEFKRQQEREAQKPSKAVHDISSENPITEKEEEDEKENS